MPNCVRNFGFLVRRGFVRQPVSSSVSFSAKASDLDVNPSCSLWPIEQGDDFVFVVRPDLDFRVHFQDLDRTLLMLGKRGIDCTRDQLASLASDYNRFCEFSRQKLALEQMIANKTNVKRNLNDPNAQLLQLSAECRRLRPAINKCLQLPNPKLWRRDASQPISSFRDKRSSKPSSSDHMTSLLRRNLATVKSGHIFLTGQAEMKLSHLEKMVLSSFNTEGFVLVSLPYLVRPALVDACYTTSLNQALQLVHDHKPSEKHHLTLVGNQLPAYGALLCRKLYTQKQQWPIKLYCSGTAYGSPSTYDNKIQRRNISPTLYTCNQRRTVTACLLTPVQEDLKDYLDELVEMIKQSINEIGISQYYACQAAPQQLSRLESARIDILTDAIDKESHCIASVSCFDTHLSRRLRISYTNSALESRYLNMIYATIDLYALLADSVRN